MKRTLFLALCLLSLGCCAVSAAEEPPELLLPPPQATRARVMTMANRIARNFFMFFPPFIFWGYLLHALSDEKHV